MTAEEIREAWSAKGATSTHYGSLLDDYIGCILTGNENDLRLFKLDNGYDYDERLHGLCDSFDNFYSILSKSGDTVFVDREREEEQSVDSSIEVVNEDNIVENNIEIPSSNE